MLAREVHDKAIAILLPATPHGAERYVDGGVDPLPKATELFTTSNSCPLTGGAFTPRAKRGVRRRAVRAFMRTATRAPNRRFINSLSVPFANVCFVAYEVKKRVLPKHGW